MSTSIIKLDNILAEENKIIQSWLHNLSPRTERLYNKDISDFLAYTHVHSLTEISLPHLQEFSDFLSESMNASTVRQKMASVRSLLTFAFKTGFLRKNVGSAYRPPKVRDKLVERILSEEEIRAMLDVASERDREIIKFLYMTGIRVSEFCALRWSDLLAGRNGTGILNVYGKGGKTRSVLIPAELNFQLLERKGPPEEPLFLSRNHRQFDPSTVRNLIVKTAKNAGITKPVSPHWMRHAHASHSMDHGAPLHVVQVTLGHSSPATLAHYLHVRPGDSSSGYLRFYPQF